jgi:hypothetical protein
MTDTTVRQARTDDHEAVAGCRFVRVEATSTVPDVAADLESVHTVGPAWQYWIGSDARQSTSGLGLDGDATQFGCIPATPCPATVWLQTTPSPRGTRG